MRETRKLFTPGPVPIDNHILELGSQQLAYNRTPEFSSLTHDILVGLNYVFQTNGKAAILTSSGTGAMEAAVLNFLDRSDRVLIINGGTFGQRWCDLCRIHSIDFSEIKVDAGQDVDADHLSEKLAQEKFTALLINAHETATGQLYDIELIGNIARQYGLMFIVDAISSICADRFFMDDWHVDVAILSSQKALALPPGLSFVAMSERAQSRLQSNKPKSLYFNLSDYLVNQERGQLPYTPAIGLLMQLHQRLLDIKQTTLPATIKQHADMAGRFRLFLGDIGLKVLASRPSNALTAVVCNNDNALEIVKVLREQYNIEVAPNGGALKDKIFRVSHMGAIKNTDVDILVKALKQITRLDSERREREVP